ncbi:MAG TPA: malto-oligosyltrehalose synthase [Sulfolobales archaeon]|nr:malto-oligosyltrehalose synthase [Sulfolobales archaeon]
MGRPLLSTYRLQRIRFKEIERRLDYFARLGITHLYLSPVLKARPGSGHGYDVVDHSSIDEELGGEEDYRELIERAKEKGIGIIQDIVPNHMAIHHTNWRLMDILEKGRLSRYYDYFDFYGEDAKIRIPILEDDPEKILDKIRVKVVNNKIHIEYGGLLFPTRSGSEAFTEDKLKLIENQYYQLVSWKSYPSYRRFFAINDLIGVRVENDWVFHESHDKILSFDVDGYRVDHIDGLFDPEGYIDMLRKRAGDRYVIVEKILGIGERLREWMGDGTTGYDFLNYSGLLFTDNEEEISRIYEDFIGRKIDLDELIRESKRMVISTMFRRDIERISRLMGVGFEELVDFLLCIPVYRTYLSPRGYREDLDLISRCSNRIRDLVENSEEALKAYMKLQQYMPAIYAKAYEDSVLFIYNRLISLNEVGSDLRLYSIDCDQFHRFNMERVGRYSFNATSTHDTKYSEDVRMRVSSLSEIPEEWGRAVKRFSEVLSPGIDRNDEYRFYQVLIGSYEGYSEEYRERLKGHVIKMLREAKIHTSWEKIDEEYERKALKLVDKALDDQRFQEIFSPLWEKVKIMGMIKSLSLTTLKITSPGVADIYQGTESWRYLLTDPDNRLPVNFDELERKLPEKFHISLLENMEDGRIKMLLTAKLLNLRKSMERFFIESSYKPLKTPPGFCGYVRGDRVLVIVRTLVTKSIEKEIKISRGSYVDVITGEYIEGERIRVDDIRQKIPVILVKEANK